MAIAVCLALAVALIYLAAVSPSPRCRARAGHLKGIRYAHRGLFDASRGVPENSLAAFEAACQAGYGIELDVQITSDGQLVVFHDDTTSRMCGVDGRVWEQPLSALGALRLQGTEHAIPTFDEVLSLVAGRVPLLVEVKTSPRWQAATRLTAGRMRAYSGPYVMESFDPRIVRELRGLLPGVARGQLVSQEQPGGRFRQRALYFALGRLWLNALSRPDFIAFDAAMDASCTLRVQRALRTPTAVWTVRSQPLFDHFAARGDAVIFEGFIPRE